MKGILAILIAGILAVAMVAPAMGTDTSATVNDAASTYNCAGTSITTQPVPGVSNGTINYDLVVSDDNGGDTIPDSTWTAEVNFGGGTQTDSLTAGGASGLTKTCTGTGNVPMNTAAGDYTVTFKLGTTTVCTTTVTVGEVLSISVTNMSFGAVNPGSPTNSGTHVVTNTGNVNVTFVDADGLGYDDDDDGIIWDNMVGSGTATGETIADTQLTTDWLVATEILVGGNADVDFNLNVPTGLKAGDYTGSTTFTPAKA